MRYLLILKSGLRESGILSAIANKRNHLSGINTFVCVYLQLLNKGGSMVEYASLNM